MRRRTLLTVICCCVVSSAWTQASHAADSRFELSFPKTLRAKPFSGRVYVFFSKRRAEPRTGPGWFQTDPFVSLNVENWEPGEPLAIDNEMQGLLAFPKPLDEMNLAGYRAQAVARFDTWSRNVGTGAGNGFSQVVGIGGNAETLRLVIDEIVPAKSFEESDRRKLCEVRSKSLSDFHGRDVFVRAAVHLPAEYAAQPERRYPVVFYVPGFGGTLDFKPNLGFDTTKQPFIEVMLDPSCPLGHHVFADSANNGPWGTALVEEWLPEFDRQFRTIPESSARFLTGHSSGGWATLWMQVTHPDVFGGTWSTAPDPVDFRDFQRIDLYDETNNVHVDEQGKPRPLARVGGRVIVRYRDFDQMENVLGPGGQLHSFEAAFSPRGADGRPLRAWDRKTGRIDTDVTKRWEPYDIRLVLERNWSTLEPQLRGKLHVVMGEQDTFYLEGATRLLKGSLAKLGSDAVVEMVPNRDHMNLLTPKFKTRIANEMIAKFRENHAWPPKD